MNQREQSFFENMSFDHQTILEASEYFKDYSIAERNKAVYETAKLVNEIERKLLEKQQTQYKKD